MALPAGMHPSVGLNRGQSPDEHYATELLYSPIRDLAEKTAKACRRGHVMWFSCSLSMLDFLRYQCHQYGSRGNQLYDPWRDVTLLAVPRLPMLRGGHETEGYEGLAWEELLDYTREPGIYADNVFRHDDRAPKMSAAFHHITQDTECCLTFHIAVGLALRDTGTAPEFFPSTGVKLKYVISAEQFIDDKCGTRLLERMREMCALPLTAGSAAALNLHFLDVLQRLSHKERASGMEHRPLAITPPAIHMKGRTTLLTVFLRP